MVQWSKTVFDEGIYFKKLKRLTVRNQKDSARGQADLASSTSGACLRAKTKEKIVG